MSDEYGEICSMQILLLTYICKYWHSHAYIFLRARNHINLLWLLQLSAKAMRMPDFNFIHFSGECMQEQFVSWKRCCIYESVQYAPDRLMIFFHLHFPNCNALPCEWVSEWVSNWLCNFTMHAFNRRQWDLCDLCVNVQVGMCVRVRVSLILLNDSLGAYTMKSIVVNIILASIQASHTRARARALQFVNIGNNKAI